MRLLAADAIDSLPPDLFNRLPALAVQVVALRLPLDFAAALGDTEEERAAADVLGVAVQSPSDAAAYVAQGVKLTVLFARPQPQLRFATHRPASSPCARSCSAALTRSCAALG